MKILLYMGIISFLTSCFVGKNKKANLNETVETSTSIYNFKIKSLTGDKMIDLSEYKGKYIVFVNVASRCGYTPQYELLEKFYKENKEKNVVVLGFPCNQFGGQEPGTAEEIQTFCSTKFDVSFPMTEKIDVKGDNQNEIYKWLTQKSLNGTLDSEVKWNFNKFIVNKEGKLTHYFGSSTKPSDEEFLKSFNF